MDNTFLYSFICILLIEPTFSIVLYKTYPQQFTSIQKMKSRIKNRTWSTQYRFMFRVILYANRKVDKCLINGNNEKIKLSTKLICSSTSSSSLLFNRNQLQLNTSLGIFMENECTCRHILSLGTVNFVDTTLVVGEGGQIGSGLSGHRADVVDHLVDGHRLHSLLPPYIVHH